MHRTTFMKVTKGLPADRLLIRSVALSKAGASFDTQSFCQRLPLTKIGLDSDLLEGELL